MLNEIEFRQFQNRAALELWLPCDRITVTTHWHDKFADAIEKLLTKRTRPADRAELAKHEVERFDRSAEGKVYLDRSKIPGAKTPARQLDEFFDFLTRRYAMQQNAQPLGFLVYSFGTKVCVFAFKMPSKGWSRPV